MFSPILLTIGDNIDKAFYAFDLWVFRFFGSMQCGFLTGRCQVLYRLWGREFHHSHCGAVCGTVLF